MKKNSKRVLSERVQRRCEEIRKQLLSVEIDTEHPDREYLLTRLRDALAAWRKELDRVF